MKQYVIKLAEGRDGRPVFLGRGLTHRLTQSLKFARKWKTATGAQAHLDKMRAGGMELKRARVAAITILPTDNDIKALDRVLGLTGFLSWDCHVCGHPLLCREAFEDRNFWMNRVAIIPRRAKPFYGNYDGHGRVSGREIKPSYRPTCYHYTCWSLAGNPTDYKGESHQSVDRGWFFSPNTHNLHEPQTLEEARSYYGLPSSFIVDGISYVRRLSPGAPWHLSIRGTRHTPACVGRKLSGDIEWSLTGRTGCKRCASIQHTVLHRTTAYIIRLHRGSMGQDMYLGTDGLTFDIRNARAWNRHSAALEHLRSRRAYYSCGYPSARVLSIALDALSGKRVPAYLKAFQPDPIERRTHEQITG